MRKPIAIFCIILTKALFCMQNKLDNQEHLQLISHVTNGSTTRVEGIIDKSDTGTLECTVKHSSRDDSYWGSLRNNNYVKDTIKCCKECETKLSPSKAEEYFVKLTQPQQ